MKNLLRWALPWVVAACMHNPTAAYAQSAPPGSLAFTTCLGGHIYTYINAEIVGTDSAAEILAHEAVHRTQARRAAPGTCPMYTPWKLLESEVEAYCVSRPLHMARRYTELETDVNYLTRLFNQFKGAMPRYDIIRTYRTLCPAKGVYQIGNMP